MSQPLPPREPVRPAVLSLASRVATLKDATRRLRRWPRERARPSLTAAPRLAFLCSGRGEKTALQPNQKTGLAVEDRRTTHALQKADIYTRHRHPGRLGIGRSSRNRRPEGGGYGGRTGRDRNSTMGEWKKARALSGRGGLATR